MISPLLHPEGEIHLEAIVGQAEGKSLTHSPTHPPTHLERLANHSSSQYSIPGEILCKCYFPLLSFTQTLPVMGLHPCYKQVRAIYQGKPG